MTEQRPWGSFTILEEMPQSHKVKRIEVASRHRLSYQYHHYRSEIWIIVDGIATVTIDDVTRTYRKGDVIHIPQKARHRVSNEEDIKLVFIEVQMGSYFGEDDIVRIEDDYHRQ